MLPIWGQLAEEDQEHLSLLITFVCKRFEDETARAWLYKTANNQSRPALAARFQIILENSFNRAWFDEERWLEERLASLKQEMKDGRLAAATTTFHELVGGGFGRWPHISHDALGEIAASCNETLLERWFGEESRYSSEKWGPRLAILANEPQGQVIRDTLIKWARTRFIRHLS